MVLRGVVTLLQALCVVIRLLGCQCTSQVPLAPWHPFEQARVTPLQQSTVDSFLAARESVHVHMPPGLTPELLACSDARHSGFTSKSASGSVSPTLWLDFDEAAIFEDQQIPVYVGCQVWISHVFKFIYIRQPKASSSTIMHAIQHKLCKGAAVAGDDCIHRASEPIDDAIWNEYFVFTFVRNPWTRAVSAFTMFNRNVLRKRANPASKVPGAPCGTDFVSFANNSAVFADLCSTQQCCSFVQSQQKFLPVFVNTHVNSQAHCVLLPDGSSMVDFIGTIEQLDNDWKHVVAAINARTGRSIVPEPLGAFNTYGNGPDGAAFKKPCPSKAAATHLDSVTSQLIAEHYALDVLAFGYLPSAASR